MSVVLITLEFWKTTLLVCRSHHLDVMQTRDWQNETDFNLASSENWTNHHKWLMSPDIIMREHARTWKSVCFPVIISTNYDWITLIQGMPGGCHEKKIIRSNAKWTAKPCPLDFVLIFENFVERKVLLLLEK